MKNKQLLDNRDSSAKTLVKTDVFGIGIINEKESDILEFIVDNLENTHEQYAVVTPNPEMIVYAAKHAAFKAILNNAQIALCDGMQLFRAAAFVGKPLQERITGVQFMESICKCISRKPITVGFLGGRDGVAKLTSERLRQKYPGLKVVFIGEEAPVSSPWPIGHTSHGGDKITKIDIPSARGDDEVGRSVTAHKENDQPQSIVCDILFVAFGFPKQEEWISKNLSKTSVRVMMGVGGAFDYLSGKVSRAPLWVQKLGFEWLYRLILQPWRWRRQLALIEFLWLVIKEKMKK